MANEAVIIEAGEIVNRTIAAAGDAAIKKGTLLKLADPNTASAATGVAEAFGGIAAMDSTSGATTISAYMSGVFDLTNGLTTTIATGDALIISGANLVGEAVAANLLTGSVIGYAEEDASASEVIRVRLRGI